MCDYLRKLAEELAKPSWMAGTGLPLLVTFLGLVLAYQFWRHQMASDRALRAADRRQSAANQLGAALEAALEEFRQTPATDPWWGSHYWHAQVSVQREVSEALLSLHDTALAELALLIDDIGAAWQACLIGARRLESPPDKEFHKDAMRYTLGPYLEAFLTAATALRLWNGEGTVPESPSGVQHQHVGGDRNAWGKERITDYQERIRGKRGVILRKPVGVLLWSE